MGADDPLTLVERAEAAVTPLVAAASEAADEASRIGAVEAAWELLAGLHARVPVEGEAARRLVFLFVGVMRATQTLGPARLRVSRAQRDALRGVNKHVRANPPFPEEGEGPERVFRLRYTVGRGALAATAAAMREAGVPVERVGLKSVYLKVPAMSPESADASVRRRMWAKHGCESYHLGTPRLVDERYLP